jgi:hypothetical protein
MVVRQGLLKKTKKKEKKYLTNNLASRGHSLADLTRGFKFYIYLDN